MKPKLLHIIDTFSKGGAEVLLAGIVPEMGDYDHIILYLNYTKSPIIKSLPTGSEIICLNFKGLLDSYRIIDELNKRIKLFNPAIIHTHLYYSSLLIRFSKIRNIPIIQTYHNEYYRIKYTKLSSRIFKVLMKFADRYSQNKNFKILHVSKTQQAANDFDLKIKTSDVLYNYIENSYFKERINPTSPFRRKVNIISVGNLKTEKNHIVFLEALRKLRHIPLHVNICGNGIDVYMLQAFVNKYDLPVTFLGSKENISELLDEHDLFVSCAIIEGFGISVAEAMASEIPLLISDIPTFKEITQNKAEYFDPKSPSDLAQKIEAFYLNPNTLNQKIKDCKQVALNYNKDQYIKNLNTMYKIKL